MAAEQRIIIPYAPRRVFVPFHGRTQRWACLVAHRRAGKTVACINDMLRAALNSERERSRYAYIAPLYKQAKAVAWDYLQHFSRAVPGTEFNQSELRADLPNGSRITLYGADNPDALRGIYLDGVILDEYGNMNRRMLSEIIRPALADRTGWLAAIGTSNGKNAFCELHAESERDPAWFSGNYKASQTGILPQAELDDARRLMTSDQYEREFENNFDAAVEGAIYRTEIELARKQGRICSVPYDPAVPVHVAWDLGIGDATALWLVQIVGKAIHLIDFYESSGEGLVHYCGWLDKRGYRYGDDLLPHDAKARDLGTGKSREEVLKENGRRVKIVARLGVEEGIDALRMMFARMWIDETRCRSGLEALSAYRREWNDRMKSFSPSPVHDWSSHAADSCRYLAVGLNERMKIVPDKADFMPAPSGQFGWMGG